MKEDAEDLLEEAAIARLIKQYSEFISFPIKLWSKQKQPKQVEDEEATKKAQAFADQKAKDEGKVCRNTTHLVEQQTHLLLVSQTLTSATACTG